jgi:uncharacterized protein (TIGR02996 family)
MANVRSTFPDPTCRLPDEYGLLAKVLSTPHDDTAKVIYADWLEDREDPRGPFLRDWVQAKSGKKPRVPKGISKSWLSLMGIVLDSQLQPFENAKWANAARQTALPSIIAKTKRSKVSLPRGASKVGGLPDLPADTEWPEGENGPAAFVAQWNLEELAISPVGWPLPRTGLLSVFIDLVPYIEDLGAGIAKVIYSPDLAELEEREPDEERDEMNVLRECSVEFREWLTIPHETSSALTPFKLTKEQLYDYSAFYFDVCLARTSGIPSGSHQLLGHTCPIQASPIPAKKGWELLYQVGPDDAANLEACDGGTWYLLTKTSDLKKAKFDGVDMAFDSG